MKQAATTTMYIARHHTAWVSARLPQERQRHYHVKLLVALDSSLLIETERRSIRGRAGIIAPDVSHATWAEGRVLGVLLDPRTDEARRIRHGLLAEHPVVKLADPWVAAHLPRLRNFATHPRSAGTATALVRAIATSLSAAEPPPPRDARVTAALDYASAHTQDPIRLGDLARVACLSPDRFAHLFRDEMGVSVRRFVLWLRVRRANKLVLGGASLTAAAHAAGFTDSAHLSHSYRQLFGVSPSTLLGNDDVRVVVGH